jgi:hypothetical protein
MHPLLNAETRTTIVRFVKSVLLFVSLATLESGAAAAAPPDAGKKDVTITVVDDPDQLSEKVNTISLPAADDDKSEASAKPGKEAENVDESSKSDAEDTRHDAGDKAQGDTGDSKQDASDAQQQDAQHPEGA